jgi:hypothetical protein
VQKMIRVKFSMNGSNFPLIWQTPGGKGIWGECEFILDSGLKECDYWFVCENLKRTETTLCPRSNVIFITGEPPEIRRYNPLFLRQFSRVLTSQPVILHRNVVQTQTGLPWYVGVRYRKSIRSFGSEHSRSYDVLKSIKAVKKTKMMSVITSDKVAIKGHRKRLEFVQKLEKRFGDQIDVFITSRDDLEDKWDAIAPYKFHIAIENTVCRDYWTEKLADAYLGLSYPIYHGCPNLNAYFPSDSFSAIDINDFEGSAKIIESLLQLDVYQERLSSLQVAKDLVLDKYNLFALMAGQCSDTSGQKKEMVTIKPELVLPRGGITKAIWNKMKAGVR